MVTNSHVDRSSKLEKLLTKEELAEYLGIRVRTIYKWTHEEYIPFTKLGKLLRFRECDIARWLEKHTKQGKDSRKVSENIWRELQSEKYRPPKRQKPKPVPSRDQENVNMLTASAR